MKEPRPVLKKSHCPRLTVQEAFWPTLGIQVGLVLLAVEAQQTLLVAEMTNLPTPVDGFQQLPLALTGMAPGSLRALTEWSDLPLRNMPGPLFYDKPCFLFGEHPRDWRSGAGTSTTVHAPVACFLTC